VSNPKEWAITKEGIASQVNPLPHRFTNIADPAAALGSVPLPTIGTLRTAQGSLKLIQPPSSAAFPSILWSFAEDGAGFEGRVANFLRFYPVSLLPFSNSIPLYFSPSQTTRLNKESLLN